MEDEVARIAKRLDELDELETFARGLPRSTVSDKAGVYFHRYRVAESKLFAVYLHHFLRASTDEGFHNHKRSAVSLVLRGGYSEQRMEFTSSPDYGAWKPKGERHRELTYRAGDSNRLHPCDFHRITRVYADCWTLFSLTGPEEPHAYLNAKGELVQERV